MYFLREQLLWSLWLLISGVADLCFYSCWLVWPLLYVFMAALKQKDSIFFIKVFTTSKTFEILIIHILIPLKAFALYNKWEMTNEKWQMTNDKWQLKNEMKFKNETTANITITSWRFSQASTIIGSFWAQSQENVLFRIKTRFF